MQTDTPSFTEHSAPPFHIRLPVAAGRPAWVPHLLRCLQAHGSRPGASLQPGDTIPTGAPLDLARSALSGCVMAPHPDRPDQILVVGVTGAERFMAQRISTDRLLEVVRTVEPDLITDVRRGCFVGDPRTAEALAGSATVPPPACVPTSRALGVWARHPAPTLLPDEALAMLGTERGVLVPVCGEPVPNVDRAQARFVSEGALAGVAVRNLHAVARAFPQVPLLQDAARHQLAVSWWIT
jgi:hypothetical protein